ARARAARGHRRATLRRPAPCRPAVAGCAPGPHPPATSAPRRPAGAVPTCTARRAGPREDRARWRARRGGPVLRRYRVLDLTDRRSWLAGFLLAQLGADVVLAEPSGGWPRDDHHLAYNRGKRSVLAAGPGDVATLAAGADVVLDDGSRPDVDLDAMRAASPALVTVSISPYGESGPKAGWLATDLTLFAASGQMAVTGDNDRPPVRTSVPQAWLHGASDAAVGALVALHERMGSGRGQHVSVSVQQSVTLTALPAVLFAAVGLDPARRESGGIKLGPTRLRWVYPAEDGFVAISLAFGPMIGPFQARLMAWVYEEGHCDEAMRDKDWVGFGDALASGKETFAELDRAQDAISALTSSKTKAELLAGAMARRLLLAPVSTIPDVLASPQLEARGYWDEAGGLRHPGPMARASATPLPRLAAAPSVAGDDDDAVRAAWSEPREAGTRAVGGVATGGGDPRRARAAGRKALEGLKVLDLAWVAAAPLATRLLAYWGATVVRVESSTRPDLTRVALGHRDDVVEVENAICWQAANAGKLGVALDLAVPDAKDVVRDLARWADVVVESFTPGAMARWGLGYEDLRQLNPGLVVLSSCVMGQDGPLARFAGFGNLAASVAGFFDVTGWPDRQPAGPYMAYTDYTSPRFTLCALLAALDHRECTGEGQYLDFSQMEAATHLLTPALLDYQRTGKAATRRGNLDPELVPHAVYPALGPDGWVAIVCESDAQWRVLATEMRRPDLCGLTAAERLERREEIDGLVGEWSARQDPIGLHLRLQAQGVPAHAVQHSGECLADPQLAHLGHFVWLDHPYVRRSVVDTAAQHLSRSAAGYEWPGPTYGQHTDHVLRDLLGYDDERVAALAVAGALE
ncbi:MAG: hypothetical protein GEV08_21950, partial [Acidimicrobiia bacterium]|nr:hypothetical protein [Acidimicrobiia bacterium]